MTTSIVTPTTTEARSKAGQMSAEWIAGGLAWIVAGLLFADDGWRFTTALAIWFVSDLLLIVGLVSLFRLRPHGESRLGSVAIRVAIFARALFAVGEVASIASGTDEGPLIPLAALLTAVSLTTYAIVVALRHGSTGPLRWALLAMGLYPFVVMFPAVASTGEPNYVLIALWGVPAVLVGLAALGDERRK